MGTNVDDDDDKARWVGRAAVAGAALGVVLTPLHAMARHATPDGREDLELPLTRAWSEPVSEAVRPLLGWADAHTVYVTYGKLWLFVFGSAAVCAFVTRAGRSPVGLERWGWRIALPGYVLMTCGVVFTYWTPWWMDVAFLVLAPPGLLLTLVGSTVLGIALLRRRFAPRASAWLLALVIPLFAALGQAVSFGGALMPVVVAWALVGWRLARPATADAPRATTARATAAA
jgi:hypothetical protein